MTSAPTTSITLPMRFGQFGGQYVPEVLFECLAELEEAHKAAIADPEFWTEFESYYGYMNRPSKLYYAEKIMLLRATPQYSQLSSDFSIIRR